MRPLPDAPRFPKSNPKRSSTRSGFLPRFPSTPTAPTSRRCIAAKMGFPVVLKVLSPEVTHKSEVGGVELNLTSAEEVRAAFARIRDALAKNQPGAKFQGVAVQPMAKPGLELIAGIVRDERFGPLIVVGLGGIFVELLKDTALRLAPVDAKEARAMLLSLRGAAILQGARGSAAVDIDAIANAIAKLSEFAAATPEIKEMDLNPIVAYPHGIITLDARVSDRSQARARACRSAARRALREPQARLRAQGRGRHRRQEDGRLHVAARAQALHRQALFGADRSQRDPRHRGDGNRESQEPRGDHRAHRLCGQRGAAPGRAAHPEGLRRQQGRLDRIFHLGIFRDYRGARNPARAPVARDRAQLRHRAGRAQLHGALQSRIRAVQLPR